MSDTHSKINRAGWMDIPVADLDRACKFYAAGLGVEVFQETFGDCHFGVPHGFRVVALDSEGNRIALHSNTDV